MNNDPPLDQIQEPEVSTSELDEVIGANKDLFDKLNKIPEIEALGTVLEEDERVQKRVMKLIHYWMLYIK